MTLKGAGGGGLSFAARMETTAAAWDVQKGFKSQISSFYGLLQMQNVSISTGFFPLTFHGCIAVNWALGSGVSLTAKLSPPQLLNLPLWSDHIFEAFHITHSSIELYHESLYTADSVAVKSLPCDAFTAAIFCHCSELKPILIPHGILTASSC